MQAPENQKSDNQLEQPDGVKKPTMRTRGDHSGPDLSQRPFAFYIAVAVAIVSVIVACVLAFQSFSSSTSQGRDPNAALGQLEGKSPEEIQAELDRIVEEGMLNISIASTIEFADGTSEGELAIENVPSNHYLMKVEITRDDTNEVIFSTGLIEPNHHIQFAKLNTDLDAGTYACTATFSGYDSETEALVGQAGANITVIVQG